MSRAQQQPPEISEKPVIIEQTAKRWKVIQLAGAGVCLVGIALTALAISLFSSPLAIAAAMICAGGLGTIITGRTLAWWYHG